MGLTQGLKKSNVKVMLNSLVTDVVFKNNRIESLIINDSTKICGDHFIFATGGASYPLTGSKGDGQRFSSKLGHNVIDLKPSLVPIETYSTWKDEVVGLTLKNVSVKITAN